MQMLREQLFFCLLKVKDLADYAKRQLNKLHNDGYIIENKKKKEGEKR